MAMQHKTFLVRACATALATLLVVGCASEKTSSTAPTVDVQEKVEWPNLTSPIVYAEEDKAFVEDLLGKMTTEQKVGQVLQAEIQSITPEQAREFHIGSILNGGGSVPNRNPEATAKDWAAYAQTFYQASVNADEKHAGIPIIWGTDAVHGHGNLEGATIFPHNIGLGAANNAELVEKIGQATALEVRASGIEWIFAPTVAVARNDRWGRTYESYSENPELVAKLGAALVTGMQGEVGTDEFLGEDRVLATVKHFIGDGGTFGGDDQGDVRLNESELIRIHAPGYFSTLDAGALSLMASFNSINGEKMHGNQYLLTDILREKLDFKGLVVGDWNGHGQVPNCTNDSCPQSFNAGLDLFMVVNDWESMYHKMLEQLAAGEITMARLDEAVRRILLVKKALGLFDGKGPLDRQVGGDNTVIGSDQHREIARQAVRESLVLLKNNDSLLPISTQKHVLVTGPGANDLAMQAGGWTVTWQGTGTKPEDYAGATSIFEGFQQAFEGTSGSVELSADGSYQNKPDVAVVVFGETPYAEGQGDLNSLEFEPDNKKSLALLKQLKSQGIKVVSVFISGRPLWINPEINASDAFVAAWLPGSEGAGIADVLVSENPQSPEYDFTGKLSFSWPKTPLQDELNVGDEDYDPLFAYGYGLTYQDKQNLGILAEQVEGLESASNGDIDLYMGRPLQPWHVFIRNDNSNQILSGAFAQMTDGTATVRTADKDVQEDALEFTFKDVWSSGMYIASGSMDLTDYMQEGTLEVDIRVDAIQNGTLSLSVNCQPYCHQHYPLRDWALEHEGKGWQHLSIPLSCLVEEGTDIANVTRGLDVNTGGAGTVAIANVQIKRQGEPNMSCVPRDSYATTPGVLNEHWAVSWWMPRHLAKVKQAQQGTADLVMIGDSITNGWEDVGKDVWQKYFGDIDTLNLGFSGDRTENVIWRLQNDALKGVSPDLAVIMIGTNNTGHRLDSPEAIRNGVSVIIDELQKQTPDTKVLLLAIFPRSATPEDELRQNNSKTNILLEQLAQQKGVMFDSFNQAFLTEDGTLTTEIMPDLLHPKQKGYEIWAKQLKPYVDKYVGK